MPPSLVPVPAHRSSHLRNHPAGADGPAEFAPGYGAGPESATESRPCGVARLRPRCGAGFAQTAFEYRTELSFR